MKERGRRMGDKIVAKKKGSLCGKGVIGLYICAGISLIIGGYMIYYAITYIQGYYASYGMSISDGMKDVVQYVISTSGNYFGFAIMFFAAAVILKKVDRIGLAVQPVVESEETAETLEKLEKEAVAELTEEQDTAEDEEEKLETAENKDEDEGKAFAQATS